MSGKETSDAIRAEMEDALNSASIWHLNAMGWKDAYTEDDEFIGYAMWQTDPPVDEDWTTFNARRRISNPPNPMPPEWLRLLAVSGADFEGLMKAARLSIGLFLIQTKIIVANEFSDDDFFELHWMSAIIYLSTASDRLRDFLIAAAFRMTFNEYKAKGKRFHTHARTLYVTPFLEAQELFASSNFSVTLEKLQTTAIEIQRLRGKRNELIHELATTMGRREHERLNKKEQPAEPRKISFQELQESIKIMRGERARKMHETTKELSDWYGLLLRASNESFIFENRRRRDPH